MKILITGATSGIAYDLVQKLLQRGHIIYLTTHTVSQKNNLEQKLHHKNLHIFKLDIRNKNDYKLLNNLELDVLVNHAGIGYGGSIIDTPIAIVKDNFETNVFSSFALLQKVFKKMYQQNHGRIVITSSIAGILPIPFLGIYSSTKSAITSITLSLQKELNKISSPIKVILIEPGIYNTGFNDIMIENKYLWEKDSIYFKNINKQIIKQKKMFKLLGKSSNKSIVKKFIKAIESKNPHKKYRAPLLQSIMTKLYLIFIK